MCAELDIHKTPFLTKSWRDDLPLGQGKGTDESYNGLLRWQNLIELCQKPFTPRYILVNNGMPSLNIQLVMRLHTP